MIDFAKRCPRTAALARCHDRRQHGDAILDAARDEIVPIGWDVPESLLRLVVRALHLRATYEPPQIHFDAEGRGPFCQHGEVLCSTCDAPSTALARLVVRLAELAGAS